MFKPQIKLSIRNTFQLMMVVVVVVMMMMMMIIIIIIIGILWLNQGEFDEWDAFGKCECLQYVSRKI